MDTAATGPRYMQVAEIIRRRILDGDLPEGSKLPGQREYAAAHGVAVATLSRALEQLQVEGLIRTSQRGTFVANSPILSSSGGRDRVTRVLRTGSTLAAGETVIITAAELVKPPLYVLDIFGLDQGDQVVRREWHVGRGSQRRGLHVDWYPASFAALVPDLLSRAPSKLPGLLLKVVTATGRRLEDARDDMHAREADQREASYLGLKVGAPILAGAHRIWDQQGVIHYGEWCLPPLHTIGYEYRLPEQSPASP
ncbi:hypothetical protein GCM10027294_54030 [Marinactinospora endophytica]